MGSVRKGEARRSWWSALVAGLLSIGLALATLAGCRSESGRGAGPTRPAEAVLEDHRDSLFAIPGVKATGVTDWRDEAVIVVIVEDRESPAAARIPGRLEGYRVIVLDEEEVRRLGGL